MNNSDKDFEQRQMALIQELSGMNAFRRGSINTVYRKCGKKGCVCASEGHPGHGPMSTLTFREGNRTQTRSISPAFVALIQNQIHARNPFLDWCNRWRELNEERSDSQVRQLLSGESEQAEGKKKSFRPWPRKSGGKSKR